MDCPRAKAWTEGMILYCKDFSCFELQIIPPLSTKFLLIGLLVREKEFKINFKDGGHGVHLGFQSGNI